MADITPHPLRTKADSVQKIVGYAGTGVMLVAISVMVPNVERPDYLPLFLLQAAFVLMSAVVYGLLVKEPALVQKMHQKSLEMGIREDEVEKDDSPEAGGKERVASAGVIELSLVWHPGGVLEALKSTAMNAACLVVVVVAIADGFTRRALSAAPMVFLGKVSYSLYLTHAMVIGALVALLPRLGIVDPLAIAAVSLPASMLVSVVFWRIIEVPSMNLSRSLASSGPRDAVR